MGIPNGPKLHIKIAQKLVAEGLKRGASDLFLPVPRMLEGVRYGEYALESAFRSGLWIEVKALAEACHGIGAVKPDQRIWLLAMAKAGYAAGVAFGAEAGIAMLQLYYDVPIPPTIEWKRVDDIELWLPRERGKKVA
jgi:hypothetical protein